VDSKHRIKFERKGSSSLLDLSREPKNFNRHPHYTTYPQGELRLSSTLTGSAEAPPMDKSASVATVEILPMNEM